VNSRSTVTLVLAVVLIVGVLGAAAALTFGGERAARYSEQTIWTVPFSQAQAMKIIDLNGDGQRDLFLQNQDSLAVLDAQGKTLLSRNVASPSSTTMGDLDGDGKEDIAVFTPAGVTALTGAGRDLWSAKVHDLGDPARAALVRFPGGPQLVLGDSRGQLVALDRAGQERWRAKLGGQEMRGLDEARFGGTTYVVAANRDGSVAAYDQAGKRVWNFSMGEGLRRLRVYNLTGGTRADVLLGGENGRLVLLNAAEGQNQGETRLGQTITEIRDAELNGDPASREFVVGDKGGGVWGFSAAGAKLWSGTALNRVSELTGVDVDGDGVQEVLVGTDSGNLALFEGKTGTTSRLPSRKSAVERIDAGKLSGADQLVIADAAQVQLLTIRRQAAPVWYTPLGAGLLLALVIAGAAWFIATLPAKPVLRAAAEDQSVEGLLAQRTMLHESLADVERLRGSGEMPAQAYMARLRELREELASNEASLRKLNAPIKAETFRCPSCGGMLQLGTDRCDYCGQVVIR
jgi:outer membrane protein assembly factor BamB